MSVQVAFSYNSSNVHFSLGLYRLKPCLWIRGKDGWKRAVWTFFKTSPLVLHSYERTMGLVQNLNFWVNYFSLSNKLLIDSRYGKCQVGTELMLMRWRTVKLKKRLFFLPVGMNCQDLFSFPFSCGICPLTKCKKAEDPKRRDGRHNAFFPNTN